MKMSSVISLEEARKRLESISNSEYQSEQTQRSDLTGAEHTDDPSMEEIADVIMAVADSPPRQGQTLHHQIGYRTVGGRRRRTVRI